MFSNTDLNNHFKNSQTIKNQALVLAEWNLNSSDNIDVIGNYRFRHNNSIYNTLPMTFSKEDSSTPTKYYWGATDFDILVNGGLDDNNDPIIFKKGYERLKSVYSLEDCFNRFRPRSGINKVLWLGLEPMFFPPTDQYIHERPRYYAGSRDDKFKYWTSYRQELVIVDGIKTTTNFGISESLDSISDPGYYISDAVPFVKYKSTVPTNKVVVKIQTGTGSGDGSAKTFKSSLTKQENIPDKFYADDTHRDNMRIPHTWQVQALFGDTWKTLLSDDINNIPLTLDKTSVGNDGYLELVYGLIVPEQFKYNFKIAETLANESALPEASIVGYAYLVKENETSRGKFYVWNGTEYYQFEPKYAWRIGTEEVLSSSQYVTNLTPAQADFIDENGNWRMREYQYINGIRVFVTKMNRPSIPFELIEISPRLCVDITDKVTSFSLEKIASDIGNSGLPVGQLLVSNGNISIFDYDQAFNSNNVFSAIRDFMSKNLQVKFYEGILDVNGSDYYMPVKTMYADGFQDSSSTDRTLSIDLRDMFFYFESLTAPQMVLNDVTLSVAISMLLDSIGFSNYTFRRLPNEQDPVIPNFFIAPNTTVAQVLNDLATSTQSAMFFDEYNNFVVMSKKYMMPENISDRATDFTLVGTESPGGQIANIVDISNKDAEIYNDGKITYFTRYLQRSVTSLSQASQLDSERIYGYQPALLWEVSPSENVKSQNDVSGTQSSYVLTAIPLNSYLSNIEPTVSGGKIIHNTIDLGSAAYWMPRYNGYLYANGEIIKFDAVQYRVSGIADAVWITSVEEYQNYFSKLKFGGKIYPTGSVRIYAEPYYDQSTETGLKEGPVAKHGRGQFGTSIRSHNAGVDPYWTTATNHHTFKMNSSYLFKSQTLPETEIGETGKISTSLNLNVRGYISNALSSNPSKEDSTGYLPITGSVQSSALNIKGPYFPESSSLPIDHVSFISRNSMALDPNKTGSGDASISKPEAFGTRLRIIGKSESTNNSKQTADGSTQYYQKSVEVFNTQTGKKETVLVNFGGASGGLAILLDENNHTGYYFEILALSEDSSQFANTSDPVNNVFFYKVKKKIGSASTDSAIPELLWSGLAPIYVDDGKFTGQSRLLAEERPTVYDLAIEYANIGSPTNGINLHKRFNLYINGNNVAVVDDENALPDISELDRFQSGIVNPKSVGLFVRGSSNIMFEHVYGISKKTEYRTPRTYTNGDDILLSKAETDIARDPRASKENIDWVIKSSEPSTDVSDNEQFSRYTIAGPIKKSFMSSVGDSISGPQYDIWYDEFGTIMREAAYFNIRYDKAYPSMYSIVSPTFNDMCGYRISGFNQNPYGAEFMVFNITDAPLNLDSSSGNYLRIQGIAFTQESQHDLTVDEYYKKRGDLSNPQFDGSGAINQQYFDKYTDIKNSRTVYGSKTFTLEPKYIQTQDAANNLMKDIISLVSKKRKSVGVKIFANPALQLGDIVTINFRHNFGTGYWDEISGSRFVIYHMSYAKTVDGPETTLYLSEVV